MATRTVIRYTVEPHSEGKPVYLVVRTVEHYHQGQLTARMRDAVRFPGSTVKDLTVRRPEDAVHVIQTQLAADCAAATRLALSPVRGEKDTIEIY